MPPHLFGNLTRVARPVYAWTPRKDGRAECNGHPCSPYAVCMSGALRSFWQIRTNIEFALLLPNGPADLFAHVFYEPHRTEHRRGLQWIRNAPYTRSVIAEVFDETLEEDIVASFPEYERLRREDTYGIITQGKETSAWLSMLRKMRLANDLRKAHEVARQKPYVAVVRTRPDIFFGVEVPIARLNIEASLADRSSPLASFMPRPLGPTDVLITPIPPVNGSMWRFCAHPGGFVERYRSHVECGDEPSDVCTPSPLAQLVGTSANCPCCYYEHHRRANRSVCTCNMIFPPGKNNQRKRRMSRRDAELFDGHGPWNEQILLDQLAIGTPRAMDVFTSLAAALPDAFARKGARRERMLQEAGFVTEGLLAQNVARYKQWLKVRPVTWLQWGSKQDGGQEREWRNSGTHRGGRHAWTPPPIGQPPRIRYATPQFLRAEAARFKRRADQGGRSPRSRV